MREMTGRLLAIYAEYRTPPSPGLSEFADRIGVEASPVSPRQPEHLWDVT